ncbi:MAG: DUF4863 family protein [Aquabacterium sp.]|nr:DUF4863 family protein [Aquabacterium sp.]
MPQSALHTPLAALMAQTADRPLDAALGAWLNAGHGACSATFATLQDACQQGSAEGWVGRPPRSAHPPTVTGGHALVPYLLPEGRIDFTT